MSRHCWYEGQENDPTLRVFNSAGELTTGGPYHVVASTGRVLRSGELFTRDDGLELGG